MAKSFTVGMGTGKYIKGSYRTIKDDLVITSRHHKVKIPLCHLPPPRTHERMRFINMLLAAFAGAIDTHGHVTDKTLEAEILKALQGGDECTPPF